MSSRFNDPLFFHSFPVKLYSFIRMFHQLIMAADSYIRFGGHSLDVAAIRLHIPR
jgi:hypothetical protein